MALPSIMRKLFRNDGYGPLLKPEIIPFASDLASRAADVAASTEWVKNLMGASIYVDPLNGDDSRDGMTQATAVRHINRAVALAASYSDGGTVNLLGGDYIEDVEIAGRSVKFVLLGNVKIKSGTVDGSFVSGRVVVCDNSIVYFSGASYTLTVESVGEASVSAIFDQLASFSVIDSSSCLFDCGLNAKAVSGYFHDIFLCDNGSRAIFNKNCLFTGESASYFDFSGVACRNISYLNFSANVTISIPSSVNVSNGLISDHQSAIWMKQNGVALTLSIDTPSASTAINCYGSSFFSLENCIVNLIAAAAVVCGQGSTLVLALAVGQSNVQVTWQFSRTDSGSGSFIYGFVASGVQLIVNHNNASVFVAVAEVSMINIFQITLSLKGHVTHCVFDSAVSSYLNLGSTVSFTDSTITGTKCIIGSSGILNTSGKGVSGLPGDSNTGGVVSEYNFKDTSNINRVISTEYAHIY